MFDYLKGELVCVDDALIAVLDVSGVGYKIYLNERSARSLKNRLGEKLLLYVSLVVKEIESSLYGFITRGERECFNFLVSLSGIGPKTGLNVLNLFSLSDLLEIVKTENVRAIATVPGIGKKTAEKLMVDLKNKIPTLFKSIVVEGEEQPVKTIDGSHETVLQTLLRLGYPRSMAESMLAKTLDLVPAERDASVLLKLALKNKR
ncbi:MAG: Holliday junction branch migration protein RuvA [Victivallaceae bacterium]